MAANRGMNFVIERERLGDEVPRRSPELRHTFVGTANNNTLLNSFFELWLAVPIRPSTAILPMALLSRNAFEPEALYTIDTPGKLRVTTDNKAHAS
tara:strand:- start:2774 stop:3061 length:288 start_codon:yes stop_codon:yes gene_type:complete